MHPDYQIVYDTDGALERLRRRGALTDRQCSALVYVLTHGDELYAQITRFRTAIETVLASFPRCGWCGRGTTTLRDVNGVKPMCADCARQMEFPVEETVAVDLAPLEAALEAPAGASPVTPGATAGAALAPDPGAHLHNCPVTSMRCPVCPKSDPQACEPTPAPVVPPALPWVVRRKENGRAVAAFFDAGLADDFMRDMRPLSDTFEVAPAAPAFVPVGFDEDGLAHGPGWHVDAFGGKDVCVTIDLRPGEDAGVLLATLLAAIGRGE